MPLYFLLINFKLIMKFQTIKRLHSSVIYKLNLLFIGKIFFFVKIEKEMNPMILLFIYRIPIMYLS